MIRQSQFPTLDFFNIKGAFGPRKINFFGNPYHGLVEDRILTLPNTDTKFYSWLPTASTAADKFNERAAIAFRKPGQPTVTRSMTQAAADATNGWQWPNYALICQKDRWLWGLDQIGSDGDLTLGPLSWLYCDPGGTVWLIKPTNAADRLVQGVAFPDTGSVWGDFLPVSIEFTIKKFGYFASTPAKQAVQNAISFTKTVDFDFTFDDTFYGSGGPPTLLQWTIDTHTIGGGLWGFFVGTHSLDGSKVAVHLIYDPSFVNQPTFVGRVNCGTLPQDPFYFEGPPVSWVLTVSGTPGVDFDISIAESYSKFDANHILPGDPFTFPGDYTRDLELHTWIKPDGTVEVLSGVLETEATFGPRTNTVTWTLNYPNVTVAGTALNDQDTPSNNFSAIPIPQPCSAECWMVSKHSGGSPLEYSSVQFDSTLGNDTLSLVSDSDPFIEDKWFVSVAGPDSLVYDFYYGGSTAGADPHHKVYV